MSEFARMRRLTEKPATPPGRRERIGEACGIAALVNVDGRPESGARIGKMLRTMADRENGLGAGYAAYGLFPERPDLYCLQMLLDDREALARAREFLGQTFLVDAEEEIPTFPVGTLAGKPPVCWRFFVAPPKEAGGREDDYVMTQVFRVNGELPGAFVMSSGKDMAVFKGNGWSHEIYDFYGIGDYRAPLWLAHSRFPTNSPGWWGGAHPFNILGLSIIHNGEITSYGTNRRFVEMWGYRCTLLTDSEVIAYTLDLLLRQQRLPELVACAALTPPYHFLIDEVGDDGARELLREIRKNYRSAMLNGPFSIAVATNYGAPTLLGMTDRKKLRPLVAATSADGDTVFLSSEECAIAVLGEEATGAWAPHAGKPVIAGVGRGLAWKGTEDYFEGLEVAFAEGQPAW
jgi:glutamate synthase domain-containing protein 1